ncbi:MAG: glutathione S-transferase family protein [Parvularculaceae bacterium]
MADLTLVIGDKHLSSWSLRPWLVLQQAGVPFTERLIRLDRPESRETLRAATPAGRVPTLIDGDLTVWESLAICEYLADKFPEKRLWPPDPTARAHARAIASEMHAGFGSLRTVWPMMFAREGLRHTTSGGVARDIARIAALRTEALERIGGPAGGPFLYGRFSIADAFYAPVVSRFVTYGPVTLPAPARAWADMMWALPAMRAWGEGAAGELREAEA